MESADPYAGILRAFDLAEAMDGLWRGIDYSGMEPRKNPRQPIFRDHNCGGCSDGERPCREGNYNNCSNPRARND
jgi:hypothetical protein